MFLERQQLFSTLWKRLESYWRSGPPIILTAQEWFSVLVVCDFHNDAYHCCPLGYGQRANGLGLGFRTYALFRLVEVINPSENQCHWHGIIYIYHRRHRRMFHQYFQPRNIALYHPIQKKMSLVLLDQLLCSSAEFAPHIRQSVF